MSRFSVLVATAGLWFVAFVALLMASSSSTLASSTLTVLTAPCPAWNVASTPNAGALGNILTGVSAASPNEVWAVGYTIIGKTPVEEFEQTLAMRWNGSEWKIVSSPNPGQISNFFNSVIA